jgi:hypothetical protein
MRPLEGITVLALEHVIAAPLATRQLADLGARVIKIERTGGGDQARGYDQRARGLSSHFVWTNRGKESLTLDLKQPAAQAVLQRLVARADVLVQNLAPGAAARLGLSHAALKDAHPRLIVCDISGYGDDPERPGPLRDKKAYDLLIQSEAGFLSVTGTPEAPAKAGASIADIAAGMVAYSSILAALIQRGRTGQGCRLDVSMLEAMVEWMGSMISSRPSWCSTSAVRLSTQSPSLQYSTPSISRISAWWMWPQTTPSAPRLRASRGHRGLEVADVADGALDLELEVADRLQYGRPRRARSEFKVRVDAQRELVGRVAHVGQPLGALDDAVEVVAVRHPQPAAVGQCGAWPPRPRRRRRSCAPRSGARTRRGCRARRPPSRALARLAQQLLHHVVVRLRPVPAAAQLPAVDDVAHQVQRLALHVRRKSSRPCRLAAGRAQVQVGDPHRAHAQAAGGAVVVAVAGRVSGRCWAHRRRARRRRPGQAGRRVACPHAAGAEDGAVTGPASGGDAEAPAPMPRQDAGQQLGHLEHRAVVQRGHARRRPAARPAAAARPRRTCA